MGLEFLAFPELSTALTTMQLALGRGAAMPGSRPERNAFLNNLPRLCDIWLRIKARSRYDEPAYQAIRGTGGAAHDQSKKLDPFGPFNPEPRSLDLQGAGLEDESGQGSK
jgi:hypothetical protein